MEQKHILMVDDVTTNLKWAGEVLKDTYQLSMAKSGKQALQFLERSRPDLVLLDINMPEMDGYETMQKMKAVLAYASIPVVFLTGDSESESEIKGLKLGAMDFIRKPFEPDVMKSRIAKVFEIEETKRTLEITASKDVLTKLWNRGYMESRLNEFVSSGASGFFVLFDMDNFKKINDCYGHIMGDAVLVKFAEVIKGACKREDVACRFGGDEFAMFINGKQEKEAFSEKITGLLHDIEKQINLIKGDGVHASVSAGISILPQDGKEFLTLYNKADKALYHVKQNGKGSFHFYHDKESYSFLSETSTNVDLMQLQQLFQERDTKVGAFDVEYEGFKRIYQFIERCVERSNREVQILLFTLDNIENANIDTDKLDSLIEALDASIVHSLRRGDVATKYSSSQYVVILMDASLDNSKMVAERVCGRCIDSCQELGFGLRYDIRTVEKPKR